VDDVSYEGTTCHQVRRLVVGDGINLVVKWTDGDLRDDVAGLLFTEKVKLMKVVDEVDKLILLMKLMKLIFLKS